MEMLGHRYFNTKTGFLMYLSLMLFQRLVRLKIISGEKQVANFSETQFSSKLRAKMVY